MNQVRSLFRAALLAAVFTGGAYAAPSLTEFLPAESLLVMHSDNGAETRRLWKASPWAKTWEDEQMQRFVAPLMTEANFAEMRENIKKETGKTLEEFMELFDAQVTLALTRVEFVAGNREPQNMHGVLLLELGGKRAQLEEMLRHGEHKNERTEEFRGVTITEEVEPEEASSPDGTGDEKRFCHALIDDYWVAGMPKKAIQQIIVAIQQGGETDSLAKSPSFTSASQRVGAAPAFIYCNAGRFVAIMRDVMEAEAAKDRERNPRGNPMGLTPGGILRATGLDTIEALYVGMAIQEDFTETRFALTFTEERGLTKLFAASEGDVALPRWVRPDWPKVAAVNLPVPHIYSVLEEIVQGLNPGLFTMLQGQLQMMQQNTGVDLKRDLIESLGRNFVVAYVPKGAEGEAALFEEGENLVAISAANPEKLRAAMESFGTMGGKMPKSMFETREYLGAKIYSLPANPATPGKGLSFVIHEGWFILSVVQGSYPIEAVLQGMHQADAPSLWEQPSVRQVMAELPPRAFGYAYQDMPVVLAGLSSMLAKLQTRVNAAAEQAEEPELDEEGNEIPAGEKPAAKKPTHFVDPEQQPTVEMFRRYWSTAIGGNWHDAHSFTGVTRISHRPDKP